MLLTCKHIAEPQFRVQQEECYVCFETSQKGFNFVQDHKCGRFYKLTLLAVASSDSDLLTNETDPITNEPYSVSFDAAMFKVNEICICGAYYALPELRPNLLAKDSPSNSEIKFVGFIGEISEKSAPLLPLTSNELRDISNTIIAGTLTERYGRVLNAGELIAISCPSTNGFSGSPVLWKSAISGQLKAFAIFIGGPALSTHKKLLEIASIAHTDFEIARNLLLNLMLSLGQIPAPALVIRNLDILLHIVQKMYGEAILDARQRNLVTTDTLNHNLCLPLKRIEGFLLKFSIALI